MAEEEKREEWFWFELRDLKLGPIGLIVAANVGRHTAERIAEKLGMSLPMVEGELCSINSDTVIFSLEKSKLKMSWQLDAPVLEKR